MFKMIRIVTIFVLIVPAIFHLLIPDNNENHSLDLANLAMDIFDRECQTCGTILIISSTNDVTQNLFHANISLTRTDATVLSIKVENFSTFQIGKSQEYFPDMTIIFINEENSEGVEEIIFALELEPYWNIRGKFLVIARGLVNIGDDWIMEVFQSFWSRQALNVLLCLWNDGSKIYSYDPYHNNYKIDLTNVATNLYRKKVRNMNGYPLKLYLFDAVLKDENQVVMKDGKPVWQGRDGLFYTTMMEILNGSIEVHRLSEDFHMTLVNQANFNIPFAEFLAVLKNAYDFEAIFNCIRLYKMEHLDYVPMNGRSDFLLVVPKGEGIPPYMYLFGMIPMDVWLAITVCLIAVTITIFAIQKYYFKKNDVIVVFMDNVSLLLSESIPERDRKWQARFVLFSWMAQCIVVSALIQSTLTTCLVAPPYYHDVDTLQDLYKTNMKIYAPEVYHAQMANLFHDDEQFIEHLARVPTNITVYGRDISWTDHYRQHHAVLMTEEQVYKLKVNNPNKIRPNFHVMKDSALPNIKGYIIRKDKPYYEEILEVMGWICQAGLDIYWRSRNYEIEDNTTTRKESFAIDDGYQPINMEHLQPAFMLLVCGLILATVVFVCELIVRPCKKGRNQKIRNTFMYLE